MKFHEKIRNAREDMDLSQKEVADMIPMNQSNYSKIERGVQEPNIDQLRRICQILRVDPRFLLDLPEFKNQESANNILLDLQKIVEKYQK